MARRDWIKVRSAWWTDPDHAELGGCVLGFGIFLLHLADSDPTWRDTGVGRLVNGRGTALTLSSIARRTGVERRQADSWLGKLLGVGTLAVDADGTYYFPNYRKHQEDPAAHRMRKMRSKGNSGVTVTHDVTGVVTDEERREKREEEKREEESASPPKRRPTPSLSPEACEASQYLYDAIRSHTPAFMGEAKPAHVESRLAGWARDIDVGMRNDGMTLVGCRAAIDAAHRSRDDFWHGNLLSGKKLRQHYEKFKIRSNGKADRTIDYDPDAIDYGAVAEEMKSWTTPKPPT